MSAYIANKQELLGGRWTDLLSVVSKEYRSRVPSTNSLAPQARTEVETLRGQWDGIEMEQMPNMDCLGCSTFFIQFANICDDSVSLSRIEVMEGIH